MLTETLKLELEEDYNLSDTFCCITAILGVPSASQQDYKLYLVLVKRGKWHKRPLDVPNMNRRLGN